MKAGTNHRYDAIVVGGGPAGSAAATVLAMHGRRVVVIEKEKFPRYHIGESLIPYTYFPLKRLGVIGRMRKSVYPKKYSVQFVSMDGLASHPFYFFQHLDHPASQTWQVVRGDFDLMLLNNARDKGAEVLEETRVVELLRDSVNTVIGVRAETKKGRALEFHAPVTIDASGREGFSLARNRWRVPDPKLDRVALWTYYRGAVRDPGKDEGATTIAFLPDKGWFWYIPLPDDVVSVGAVAQSDYLFRDTRKLEAIFEREVGRNKWIEQHLAPGKRIRAPGSSDGPFYLTREWSYRSRHCGADGLVLAGDVLTFLDPVFSSGVFFALKGGELAADAVHAALAAGDVSARRFREYGETMSRGIESMRRLVHAFYDPEFSMRQFVTRYPPLRGDVTDCIIGNVFRDFTRLFKAVGEFARLPAAMPCGGPLNS